MHEVNRKIIIDLKDKWRETKTNWRIKLETKSHRTNKSRFHVIKIEKKKTLIFVCVCLLFHCYFSILRWKFSLDLFDGKMLFAKIIRLNFLFGHFNENWTFRTFQRKSNFSDISTKIDFFGHFSENWIFRRFE